MKGLIVHALHDTSFFGSCLIEIFAHPVNRLLHTSTEFRTSLPVTILILMDNQKFLSISFVVDLDKSPGSRPSRIFHHKRHMFLILAHDEKLGQTSTYHLLYASSAPFCGVTPAWTMTFAGLLTAAFPCVDISLYSRRLKGIFSKILASRSERSAKSFLYAGVCRVPRSCS